MVVWKYSYFKDCKKKKTGIFLKLWTYQKYFSVKTRIVQKPAYDSLFANWSASLYMPRPYTGRRFRGDSNMSNL